MCLDRHLTAKSRITAFVRTSEGKSSVECWELDSISESTEVQPDDGHSAVSHASSISRGSGFEDLEILTFPPAANLWPGPPSEGGFVRNNAFDLSNSFNSAEAQPEVGTKELTC